MATVQMTKAHRKMLAEAKETCSSWRVDILDCSVSPMREPVEMAWEEIMAKLNENCLVFTDDPVGFRTMTDPDYFLWIEQ